ncbi:hypothetical protein HMPREF8579_1230 [Streptococcus oralis ATCC 35037]|nr:hypothetical protein HMPREF8579_1230 [Streptococcus oralis ATCC 35037]
MKNKSKSNDSLLFADKLNTIAFSAGEVVVLIHSDNGLCKATLVKIIV